MEIVLDHLTKKFPGRGKNRQEVIAVNDFTFTIPDGKLAALLGPSGCGKSTTLNMICGLLAPTSGEIFFGDNNVTALPPQERGVGMVFQNYALYPHMTVEQNIRFPLENFRGKDRLSKEAMKERVLEAAKLVHIEELLERKPSELSGGQQQRVAIARSLVKLPKVLLLDEPLSNLDARLRLATREEIRRIQQETRITTVFVTHDQDEAMSISDLIVVMKEGVLQQVDSPQKVYDDPANQFVAQFLGTPPINMFDGELKDGQLWIAGEPVLRVAEGESVPEGPVSVGIRPEGFILLEGGAMHNEMVRPEITGRDVSVIFRNKAAKTDVVRSIISAEDWNHISGGEVHFDLKPAKVYLFAPESGERIRLKLEPLAQSAPQPETKAQTAAVPGLAEETAEDTGEAETMEEKTVEEIPVSARVIPQVMALEAREQMVAAVQSASAADAGDDAPELDRMQTTFTALNADGQSAEVVLETDAVDTYIKEGEL